MRIFKLLAALLKYNVQQDLAYRSEAVIGIIMGVFWIAYEVVSLLIIFNNTLSIGGWGFAEVLALTGVWKIINTFMSAVVWPNTEKLNEGIRTGSLDYVFLQPVNSQFMVSVNRVVIWRLTELVLGVGTVAYGIAISGSLTTPLQVLAFLLLTASGLLIIYSVWVVLVALTFWFTKFDNNVTILQALLVAGRFPSTVYPAWLRALITFVIPIAVATTIPLQALRGELPLVQVIGFLAVGVIVFFLATRVWKAGTRKYSGASS
jgi:ABC-2 type transport system permease protein